MTAAIDAARRFCKKPRCMEPNHAQGLCVRHTAEPNYRVPTPQQVERAAVEAVRVKERAQKRRERICKAGECTSAAYAHGYCRSHYGRWTRYGDPMATAKVGGPKYTPDVLERAGLTRRVLAYWHRVGYLRAPLDPKGNRRAWNANEVRIALVMDRLTKAGISLERAARIARDVVESGRTQHRLGALIRLTVVEDPEHREVNPW